MNVSVLEQAKIQARVLVPLIKALQAELGEERANSIVRQALGGMYRTLGEKWWSAMHSDNLGQNMVAAFEMYAAERALSKRVVWAACSPRVKQVMIAPCSDEYLVVLAARRRRDDDRTIEHRGAGARQGNAA